MYCLACTGGIGSGKSYVVKILSGMGIPSYSADSRAKSLYYTDINLQQELSTLLGRDIMEGGILQREFIASKIFNNPKLLESVNDLVHPKVLLDFVKWRDSMDRAGNKLGVIESAIIQELDEFLKFIDGILVVIAPKDVRIERIIKRDKLNREAVLERISNQWSDEERLLTSDFIIYADGKRSVMPQVINLLDQLKWDMEDGSLVH